MSLKRYDSVGWEEMNESPTGEFVRLEDIIKLLEEHPVGIDITDSPMCDGCWDVDYDKHLIALIKGEK